MLASASLLANAQTVPTVTIDSDYRVRGVSLSGGDPALRIGIAHDAPAGWYAGASAQSVRIDSARLQLLGYAGIVGRAAQGLHWEAGASATHFEHASSYDYVEAFGGIIGQRWNARLHVSPDYYGRGRGSAYAELNGGFPLERDGVPSLRLFGHVGVLRALGGDAGRARFDMRFGASLAFDAFDAQLSWVGTRHGNAFTTAGTRRDALVLSATFFF